MSGGSGKKKQQPLASTVPAPVAPPTAAAEDVTAASRKARLGASLRRGFGARSISAGETMSGTTYASDAGQRRLLGG